MSELLLSRRAFMTAASASLMAAVLRAGEAVAPATGYPQRDRGLITLPDRGTLYVASDFHTRYTDFQAWLTRTNLAQKLKDHDDVYGLILGDALDIKPNDASAEPEGDSRIIDRIREIQEKLGEAGRRFLFIQGNHENACISIYEQLKQRVGMTRANQRQIVKRLFAGPDGEFFQQFNFLERVTDEQFAWLKKLPVAVMAGNGFVGVHAGPARKARTPRDVAQAEAPVLTDLLWGRPAPLLEDGYSEQDLAAFLKMMGDASLLVAGHTPLGTLPPAWLKNGLGEYGGHQIILGTSYGAEPGEKSYLALDLAHRYAGTRDLTTAREIQRLTHAANASR